MNVRTRAAAVGGLVVFALFGLATPAHAQAVAYADFDNGIVGQFTFIDVDGIGGQEAADRLSAETGDENDETAVAGIFSEGFTDPDIDDYQFRVETSSGQPVYNLTADMRDSTEINVPAATVAGATIDPDVDDLGGLYLAIYRNGQLVGRGQIVQLL